MNCGESWKERVDGLEHCTYCGSIRPEDAIKLLKTSGTKFSGSDWKYGWPHKFYIESKDGGHLKFYNNHLKFISDDLFKEFSKLSLKVFGVGWSKSEKELMYHVPNYNGLSGHQLWGVIDSGGNPDYSSMQFIPKRYING